MREYTVIPTIGTFNISINEEHDDFYYMSVGGAGKQFRCVNISVPKKESNNTAIISYAESKDGCTIDGAKIKGDATRQMILLGITIARELSPHITYIDLDDMSQMLIDADEEEANFINNDLSDSEEENEKKEKSQAEYVCFHLLYIYLFD